MTTKTFTAEELAAARAQIALEDAAAAEAARAEQMAPLQPLIDAGLGSNKKATIAELIAALEVTRPTSSGNEFTHINAALAGLRPLHEMITGKLAAPVVMPVPLTPA